MTRHLVGSYWALGLFAECVFAPQGPVLSVQPSLTCSGSIVKEQSVLIPKRRHRPTARSILPKKPSAPTTSQSWRRTTTYRQWRAIVFARDSNQCQFCGAKKNLTAHHIVPAASAPDLRYSALNGITLCRLCHRALDRAMGEGLTFQPSDSCAFVQIIRAVEIVRSTGDRRKIEWKRGE